MCKQLVLLDSITIDHKFSISEYFESTPNMSKQ